jgi:hypothetical protein
MVPVGVNVQMPLLAEDSLPVARVEARQMRAVLKAQINKKRQVKRRAGDAEVLADCSRKATNFSYAGPRPEDIDLK